MYYVDPMNPAHTSPEPGLAPCGMKMEPVYAEDEGQTAGSALSPGSVKITPEKQQIIGVRVATVAKSPWTYTLRTVGKVAADETRTYRVNAFSDGFIMKVYDNSTGSLVRKDEPLATYLQQGFVYGVTDILLCGLCFRQPAAAGAANAGVPEAPSGSSETIG